MKTAMAESIKLDTTVPAFSIARGSLVYFDICLKEPERRQLSERFAFIKLDNLMEPNPKYLRY